MAAICQSGIMGGFRARHAQRKTKNATRAVVKRQRGLCIDKKRHLIFMACPKRHKRLSGRTLCATRKSNQAATEMAKKQTVHWIHNRWQTFVTWMHFKSKLAIFVVAYTVSLLCWCRKNLQLTIMREYLQPNMRFKSKMEPNCLKDGCSSRVHVQYPRIPCSWAPRVVLVVFLRQKYNPPYNPWLY